MKNQTYQCKYCPQTSKSQRGLNIHKTRQNHWTDPNPPKPVPPVSKHVPFSEFGDGNWGNKMTDEEKKHPSMEQLKLGTLYKIVSLLKEILKELKRDKKII